jgi:hypothetical protein
MFFFCMLYTLSWSNLKEIMQVNKAAIFVVLLSITSGRNFFLSSPVIIHGNAAKEVRD